MQFLRLIRFRKYVVAVVEEVEFLGQGEGVFAELGEFEGFRDLFDDFREPCGMVEDLPSFLVGFKESGQIAGIEGAIPP